MVIKNTQNISEITMKPFAECICAIGKDWYHIDFWINFEPADSYPDYMDVQEFISKAISGNELNIEEAVATLGDTLWDVYKPKSMTITGTVDNVVTHFPVEVTKRYERDSE